MGSAGEGQLHPGRCLQKAWSLLQPLLCSWGSCSEPASPAYVLVACPHVGAVCRSSRDRWSLCGPLCLLPHACLESGFGRAPPELLPGGSSKPVLGLGPLRMEQSCRRDVAGEKERVGGRLPARHGVPAEFRWGFFHLAHPGRLRPMPHCPLLSFLRASAGTVPRGRWPAQQPSCRKERRETRASLACQALTTVPG